MDGVRLRRWTDADLPILDASNAPDMTRHVGGPESDDQVRRRHERYLRGWDAGMPRMFAIVNDRGAPLGSIGWWDSVLPDGTVAYETGWSVLPAHQGKGVATRGLALLVDDVRERIATGSADKRSLVAFPSVENEASNALCRRAGFEQRGILVEDFRAATLVLNVWVIDP